MSFNIIFSSIMIINAVLATYIGILAAKVPERPSNIKIMTTVVALGSAMWSTGFGIMYLITDFKMAVILRAVSLAGVFIFLVSIEILVASFSTLGVTFRYVAYITSIAGFFIFPFIISEDMVVFGLYGGRWIYYTSYFNAVNLIYCSYVVLVAVFILLFIINIILTAPNRRTRALGMRFLIVEVIIVLGMIIDVILPMFGTASIPASTVTQFYGLLAVLFACDEYDKTKITVKNMSEFVYYSLSVPVILFDTERHPVIVNDATYIFLGKDRQQIEPHNMTLETLFGLDSKEMMDDSHTRKSIVIDCIVNGANCILTINPIVDKYNDITGYIANISDNTDQVNANKRLEDAKSDAEESNRSKTAFLANVSHELRTPLNSIMGFTELLMASTTMQPSDKEFVSDIRTASKSLLSIIDDVSDISKIESGKLELTPDSFELADMIKDVYRIIEPQISAKDITLNMDIFPKLPSVIYADNKRIREVIINLLANALANTELGTIKLSMTTSVMEDHSSSLLITVSDTGKGYRPNELKEVFEAFAQVTTISEADGSGLGLALSKSYINLMGGIIDVSSTFGVGADFTVEIPIRIVDRTPIGELDYSMDERRLESSMSKADHSMLKVLITDDAKLNLKVFAHLLKSYGIDAVCTESGAEAIEACRNTEFDIIFMDQMMPEMDGVEAMKQIRQISSHYAPGGSCHISVCTANALVGTAETLISKGFDSYISKPVEVPQLEELLNSVHK